MPFDFINKQVNEQKTKSRYRQRVCINTSDEASNTISIAGKSYTNFSSNDYLGLNNHSKVKASFLEGIEKFGLCASSSSLVTGFHYAHQVLEEHICQWLGKPRCLLFSSGYAANLALFHGLASGNNTEDKPHYFLDKLSHASMIDGAYQASSTNQAVVRRFNHNNTEHLSQLLQKSDNQNKLIASEGVFSMDGCQAKVAELAHLARSQNSWLYLDDAHSVGVVGDKGQGSYALIDESSNIDITMSTFGKAIGTSGAFLACSSDVHDYLINFSRHYIYSTAISPAVAWATKKSIELIQIEQWRRDKIAELSHLFKELLAPNINLLATQSSIHAIIIGDEKLALAASEKLKKQGIWLTAIRPPTVAPNSSRLRVTICANHNRNDIMHLAENINKALA